jgi:hypothetical protein
MWCHICTNSWNCQLHQWSKPSSLQQRNATFLQYGGNYLIVAKKARSYLLNTKRVPKLCVEARGPLEEILDLHFLSQTQQHSFYWPWWQCLTRGFPTCSKAIASFHPDAHEASNVGTINTSKSKYINLCVCFIFMKKNICSTRKLVMVISCFLIHAFNSITFMINVSKAHFNNYMQCPIFGQG